MKLNRLIAVVIILGTAILALLPAALNAQATELPTFSSPLSEEESKIIEDEAVTFSQILYFYATEALIKPPDLRLCAYEMFRLTPSENSCRDKYSVWHSKEEVELLKSDSEGEFGGVGLEVSGKDGRVVVVTPIDGTPAFRAGLKPEDVIVKVDNKPVLNIMDAIARMRGKPGASVEITVKRGDRELTFRVVREVIIFHAVSSKTIDSPSGAIGYVKVRTFSKIMPNEFRAAINDLRDKGINKVILDFRNNAGGRLDSALDILFNFARQGDVSIVMRERNKVTIYANREIGNFQDLKAVVMINKGSASASEIFAGTMKDWGFPVVGSPSFGKGVGQVVFPLVNGSELRLTTFEFFAGNSNTKINDVGVIPTYKVPDSAPSSAAETPREDRQLLKAIEILSH